MKLNLLGWIQVQFEKWTGGRAESNSGLSGRWGSAATGYVIFPSPSFSLDPDANEQADETPHKHPPAQAAPANPPP